MSGQSAPAVVTGRQPAAAERCRALSNPRGCDLLPLRQRHEQRLPIRHAQSRAGIPPRARLVSNAAAARNIVPLRDLAQQSRVGVQEGQKEADRCGCALVDERGEPGPQRRNGTGAADNLGLPTYHNAITRRRRGITGNIYLGRVRNVLPGMQAAFLDLGLERDEAETIELAAPLHDIGKIGIPDQILLKPDKLDALEWEVMRRHPVIGHEILKGSASKYVRMGALIALGHHEKYDGSGYPNGLVGDHIPLCARIVAIADVYDALTSVRSYKKAWASAQALEYVESQGEKHFDPRLVEAFGGMKKEVLQIQNEWRDPLQNH